MLTSRSSLSRHAAALAALSILALAGCGEEKQAATQVAAKVNKEEISIHQINSLLGPSGRLPPEQAKLASRQVLDRLVDQELLVQKAAEKKLDREPKTMKAIEAARRDILARAYMESVASAVSKPTTAEVVEFYGKRPELFSERRVYKFQELTIGANPAEVLPKLKEIGKAKNLEEVAAWLKGQNIPFGGGDVTTKTAEQLPLELLPRFHQLKEGQMAVVPSQAGVLMIQLVASRSEPIDQKAATPFIEQFLMNQKKVEASNRELKHLHEQAKIEYLGEFAKTEAPAVPATAGTPAAGVAPPATAVAATAPAPAAAAHAAAPPPSPVPTARAAAPADAALSASTLEKGAMGLK